MDAYIYSLTDLMKRIDRDIRSRSIICPLGCKDYKIIEEHIASQRQLFSDYYAAIRSISNVEDIKTLQNDMRPIVFILREEHKDLLEALLSNNTLSDEDVIVSIHDLHPDSEDCLKSEQYTAEHIGLNVLGIYITEGTDYPQENILTNIISKRDPKNFLNYRITYTIEGGPIRRLGIRRRRREHCCQ